MDKKQKIEQLKVKLEEYQNKLAHEMKTYRGVIHESASSELKHAKVMVYQDMVRSLIQEIDTLEKELKGKK